MKKTTRTKPLTKIHHESGFNYYARTFHPELSSHRQPSSAIVLENDIPLPGPANALHDTIRENGCGKYSFWHWRVYFSTTDNTDPRINGRNYTIEYIPSKWGVFTPLVDRVFAGIPYKQPYLIFWKVLYVFCFTNLLWRHKRSNIFSHRRQD